MNTKKPTTKDTITKVNKSVKRDYIYAVGRQKEAVARVRLYSSTTGKTWGDHQVEKDILLVNRLPIEKYFPGDLARAHYMQPIQLTKTEGKFGFTIKVAGGGPNGQLDAVVKGIAKALVTLDAEKYRPTLKSHGFMARDARVRERRKVGTGGKARRQKQSPKR